MSDLRFALLASGRRKSSHDDNPAGFGCSVSTTMTTATTTTTTSLGTKFNDPMSFSVWLERAQCENGHTFTISESRLAQVGKLDSARTCTAFHGITRWTRALFGPESLAKSGLKMSPKVAGIQAAGHYFYCLLASSLVHKDHTHTRTGRRFIRRRRDLINRRKVVNSDRRFKVRAN